jgi:hypothetical protein
LVHCGAVHGVKRELLSYAHFREEEQPAMSKMLQSFGPVIKESGFFNEWSLYVDQELQPDLLSGLLMEQMRVQDERARLAFTQLLSFMKVRSWGVFLDEISTFLEPEEASRLHKPNAKEFYEKCRLLCILQIEDYWKQFFDEKQQEAKVILEGLDKVHSSVLNAKIHMLVKTEVTAQTQEALQETVVILKNEIKKLMDERDHGEGWKTGGAEV